MTQFSKPKFKRTKYLVSTKLQLRYVGIILLLMLVTALICSYIIYYTVMILMGEKLSNVYPQGRLIAIINTVNLRILFSLLLITPVVAVIGIFLSHKIAGPIYRIEKFLGDMSTGNFAARIVLRKGDELMSVADKINVLNDSLKTTIGSQKSSMGRIVAELDELKRMVNSKPGDISSLDKNIERLQNEIKDLETQLAKYKV
jgi:methyl-accepting chemotaxis protein